MRILNVCEWDWAGIGYRLTEAVNLHTNHEARHLSTHRHPFGYDDDIIAGTRDEIRRWVEWADVVNCAESGRPLNIAGLPRPKNLIFTYSGSKYWNHPARYHLDAVARGAKKELVGGAQMGCLTGDYYEPDLKDGPIHLEAPEWMPVAIPVDRWLNIKKKHGKHAGMIVCQSPRGGKKHTDSIVSLLGGRKDIRLVILKGLPWKRCMEEKSKADVYLGQFRRCYGVSSLEAMAMGIPVVEHASDTPDLDCRSALIDRIGYLPFYESEIENINNAIDDLKNPGVYKENEMKAVRYMRTYHDYPVAAKRFTDLCERIAS